MRKVGIITFHRAVNYGAMLQAVALQRAISNLGYDAEILDYVDSLYDHYKISYKSSNFIKSTIKFLLSNGARKRNYRFEKFLIENAKISETQYNRNSINQIDENQYIAFVTGSDQTFNPVIVDYDTNYTLGFVHNKSKCNSYAASIGLSTLNDKQKAWIKENVNGFHKVLVREKTGLDLLASIGVVNTTLVCDPTFLLPSEEWKSMAHKVKTPKHYILYYGFKKNHAMEKMVQSLSTETEYPIYTISDSIKFDKRGYKKFSGIGPGEWLYLIANADYIVTNSFHGMIFSFIFNKQVWIADSNDGTFSRMEDFLTKINCCNRILNDECEFTNCLTEKINYDNINNLMREYVDKSKQTLENLLVDYKK
ncbi:polysaccharide pyruvyl transferase [Fibrobacter succinogenes subsp. elongatus]|uniref:Polysaccharide pyruvyl transferase n=2 Tax=Fibrobacter succinogenes TaxID=833 RepID=A0A380RW64_FIBSU|nr:polysaccharide pyruvyl transferase [Fibrobacter succinogenes subsp. elongatus]SUQ19247.1 Polysaccharide pyruvyl transferase [Fibrobacter succinogenes]